VFNTYGLLISFEGIDGCGKSTQAGMLKDKLAQSRVPSTLVREPGCTPAGEDIRQILLQNSYSLTTGAELLLYMAARAEVTEEIIFPSLRAGEVVICDRFTDSTLAYQGYGRGVDLHWIDLLNHKATGGRLPDITFLLDLSIENAAARRGNFIADRMEKNDFYYYERVRRGYLELAAREPQRVIILMPLLMPKPREGLSGII